MKSTSHIIKSCIVVLMLFAVTFTMPSSLLAQDLDTAQISTSQDQMQSPFSCKQRELMLVSSKQFVAQGSLVDVGLACPSTALIDVYSCDTTNGCADIEFVSQILKQDNVLPELMDMNTNHRYYYECYACYNQLVLSDQENQKNVAKPSKITPTLSFPTSQDRTFIANQDIILDASCVDRKGKQLAIHVSGYMNSLTKSIFNIAKEDIGTSQSVTLSCTDNYGRATFAYLDIAVEKGNLPPQIVDIYQKASPKTN